MTTNPYAAPKAAVADETLVSSGDFTADGRGMIRSLSVDPEAFEGRDAELLSALVLSAVAEAQRRRPDFSIAKLRWSELAAAEFDHFIEGMRKAGLPE